MVDDIRIHGARQHNLQRIDATIPRQSLTVVTGLSGSGKSSLAFDTLYAEGQRRYVESLSAYARQFLDRLQKPEVDRIDGLSPAIAIEQRSAGANPRSTVATTTEIHDYLRLLYAHIGVPHCPSCGKTVAGDTPSTVRDKLGDLPEETRFMLLAPYVVDQRGAHREALDRMRNDGFVRARIDGKIVLLDDAPSLGRTRKHRLEAVVDRLVTGRINPGRLMDSIELAFRVGEGTIVILVEDPDERGAWDTRIHSEQLACLACGVSFAPLEPRHFSFNSPHGACPTCNGIGTVPHISEEKVIPEPSLSIRKGAIPLWRRGPKRLITHYNRILRILAAHYSFSLTEPWEDLPASLRDILLHGSAPEEIQFDIYRRGKRRRSVKPFEGIIPNLMRRYRETQSEAVRSRIRDIMEPRLCTDCAGGRLCAASRAVTVGEISLPALCGLAIGRARDHLNALELSAESAAIARDLIAEIGHRIGFLESVGLGYLRLDRGSMTLSGGEAQRIRLATQVGSALVGVLYILDEPSIGLHQRDNAQLLHTLAQLRDLGNTVVVVEHDMATMAEADWIIDLGPGAGRHGGQLVCQGPPADVRACPTSVTGQFLSRQRRIAVPDERHAGSGEALVVRAAAEHNLQRIDVRIPLGALCCVTGVSGSGKSTLVDDVLRRAVNRHLGIKTAPPGAHDSVEGLEHLDKMIVIDQSPIGRTPRSNPATYTGAFDHIRALFAKVPEARVRGYKPGRFSFNVKGGRCEECRGGGIRRIEMQFLPDVYVQCEACRGRRYNRETLGIKYRGRSIADVLEMTVDEGLEVFSAVTPLRRRLGRLAEVGLGYIHLGQAATTLSGGEAQRVKLATELAKVGTGHTLYILDEPTTGLHAADVEKLLHVLFSLRDQGNTILIIEHNLDVIKSADHIIDLGPEGGEQGGRVVVCGTPEQVAACPESYTGHYLRDELNNRGAGPEGGAA